MNLILLFPDDFVPGGRRTVRLEDRRHQHIVGTLRAAPGAELVVGLADGAIGHGVITRQEATFTELEIELEHEPPPALPLTLVLALPRPKVLNRVIAAVTSCGVKHIVLMNAWRVEKSYWSSPRLAPENVRAQVVFGLEQARDTVFPVIETKRFFRRFVEDELSDLAGGSLRLVAHPFARKTCPREVGRRVTLVIGPEGGFIEDEIRLLEQFDFLPVQLGPRVLRVETAIATLIGRLF